MLLPFAAQILWIWLVYRKKALPDDLDLWATVLGLPAAKSALSIQLLPALKKMGNEPVTCLCDNSHNLQTVAYFMLTGLLQREQTSDEIGTFD
jgi:hypothetical protein